MSDPSGEVTSIGAHGVIGDLETLALVDATGCIDWMCWPRFDSASLFGRLLDDDGGHWTISPSNGRALPRQLYLPETNVLITRFHHDDGMVEIQDFMVVGAGVRRLVRRINGIRGTVSMRSVFAARPDYGRSDPKLEDHGDYAEMALPDGGSVYLTGSTAHRIQDHDLVCEFDVSEGDDVALVLCDGDPTDCEILDLFDATVAYWREWSGRSRYRGRWRETVTRSALTLKLLTHASSGGVIAAGTTSLPEVIGGERNWDYRYVWIRDAAFTLYAFLELGYTAEAAAFTAWLTDRSRECDDGFGLVPLYDLDGNGDIPETTLDHWSGYRDSRPVRLGNAASGQLQLDIYGELIDSLYLADRAGDGLPLDVWDRICSLADWVSAHWTDPDEGMWEVRSGRQRFTSSLLMCWVALERTMRMASARGRPGNVAVWREARDEIHHTIRTDGWNESIGSFTQTLGGDTLDASLLLMPLVKFISPSDPAWLSTLDAIGERLAHDALVDRYEHTIDDGLDGVEGSFTACSFWYVEALARSGRVDEARLLFDKLRTYAGGVGIFSEEIGMSGEQLGNTPQAFTHLTLISAAVALDEALDAAGQG